MRKSLLLPSLHLAIAAGVLSGCSLIPDYERPEAPVAAAYPQGDAYDAAQPANAAPTSAGGSSSRTRNCSDWSKCRWKTTAICALPR